MKAKDLKIIAIILAIALVFTVLASNAVSVASIVFLAKNEVQAASSGETGNSANGGATNGGAANSGATNGGAASSGTASSGTASSGTASTGTADSGTASSGTASSGTASSGTADSGAAVETTAAAADAGNNADADKNTADAAAWDKAKTFNFYKDAAHNMATKGNAGYDKIEWQVLENLQVGSVGSLLQPVIDNFMTTKEEAEVQVQAKGSDDAKNRFPDCTLTDLSKVKSAEKKDLPNGNYEITIIMVDEDTPMNEESSFLAKVTSSVLFWEDIEETIKNDVPVVSAINSRSVNYTGYKITAEMTKDGKFVKLGHYATVIINANAKISVFTLDVGGTLYNNCEYSNFKY